MKMCATIDAGKKLWENSHRTPQPTAQAQEVVGNNSMEEVYTRTVRMKHSIRSEGNVSFRLCTDASASAYCL